jgi:8-amino-7-oxononanoate synthase
MDKFPQKLQNKLLERAENSTLRSLPKAIDLVDFSSNDYLGLGRSTSVFNRATQILADRNIKKNGATGSRLISGNSELVVEVEANIAAFYEAESALLFNSGYDANVGFFGALPQRGDVVFYDEMVHASIRDGIGISVAKGYKFKHNDLNDLKAMLKRLQPHFAAGTTIYVVTESVFSMDGDTPDLKLLAEFCARENYYLIVDEAHAVGLFGENGAGLLCDLGLQHQVFARIVTFGKALGCHGAAILGSQRLSEFLINFARSFIYTTGLPPHSLATIMAAHEVLSQPSGKEGLTSRRKKLMDKVLFFKQQVLGLQLDSFFIPGNAAIHSCLIPGNKDVKEIALGIQVNGFNVKAILSPSVPKGMERLRFCLHSYNSYEEIIGVTSLLSHLILKK